MSVIDSGKIVEVLFENSDKYPENVYLELMNMMKRHHEFGDNEPEIIEYLKKVDPSLIPKFKLYKIRLIRCPFSLCHLFSICFVIVGFISFVTVITYSIINRRIVVYYPPPSNFTK